MWLRWWRRAKRATAARRSDAAGLAFCTNSPPTFPTFEPLEPRVLLSGVTLITHGAQLFSSSRPAWLDAMAAAIVARAAPDTAVYALRIVRGSGGVAQVQSFDHLAGTPPMSALSSAGETVIMLDWADASGVIFSYTNTAVIADLVAPFLLNAVPSKGITRPLAESPIHLVGHSRGGSVVTQLARELGEQGVWVDHVTTLDPHPVDPDPTVVTFNNVVFADSYFQTNDAFIDGFPVPGAFDHNLTNIVTSHETIHTYYHGTINTQATSVDGQNISANWYASSQTGPRSQVGFAYSRIGGRDRFAGPSAAGLHPIFGSGAARAAVNFSQATWPNILAIGVNDPDLDFAPGEMIHPVIPYFDADSSAVMSFFLDADTNPYNTDEVLLGQMNVPSTEGEVFVALPLLSTTGVSAGTYRFYTQITDTSNRTRFHYFQQPITILADTTPPAVTEILVRGGDWPVELMNHLRATGLGDGGYGLPIAAGSPVVPLLPWATVDEIVVRFSEHVDTAFEQLSLHGVNGPKRTATSVAYDPATFTATWSFDAPLGLDKWLIDLSSGITDGSGNPLAGGFQFRFNVLPGDIDRSGVVLGSDVIAVRNAQFKAAGSPGYDPMLDINGSGVVLGDDVVFVRNRQFTVLPTGDPAAPALDPLAANRVALSASLDPDSSDSEAFVAARAETLASLAVEVERLRPRHRPEAFGSPLFSRTFPAAVSWAGRRAFSWRPSGSK